MKRSFLPLLFSFLFTAFLLHAEMISNQGRVEWTMDETYDGPNRGAYDQVRWQIPNLMRQTIIDMAVRLGMDFREGWMFPLTIRFMDQAPLGAEYAQAYVQMMKQGDKLSQNLVVNLAVYNKAEFGKLMAHELVHAMVNDAMEGETSVSLPRWFHEGLAVYGSNTGEDLAETYIRQFSDEEDSFFVNGLEGSHGAIDYVEDYWAFKYIYKRHGVNSLHNFVREVLSRRAT